MPSSKGVTMIVLGTAALVLFAVLQRESTPKLTPTQQAAAAEREEVEDAKYGCEEAVKGKLKAPKTAEFDQVVASVSTKDAGKIVVVGKVTAQNSFGAMLTNRFGCELDRATKTWTQVAVE